MDKEVFVKMKQEQIMAAKNANRNIIYIFNCDRLQQECQVEKLERKKYIAMKSHVAG